MKDLIWTKGLVNSKEELSSICPKCQNSKLSLIEFKEKITVSGQELEQQGYQHGIEHFFTGFLICKNCDQLVSINGTAQKDFVYTGHDACGQYFEHYFDQYFPRFYDPNLRYFKITNQIPKEIIKVIDLAFLHYFNDLNASANKIRVVIELILDEINAPKKSWSKKRSEFIPFKHNLHLRIEHFGKKNKYISRLMLANKYIGNDGSHLGDVRKEDVIDAFDNLEEILDRIYIKKQKTLVLKANQLIESRKSVRNR
jgi:hypothetical protein